MSKKNMYRDPLTNGVDMAQQGYQNSATLRNEHDEDADLFASIGAAAGPKPRGWAAFASGLAKGLEHGAKRKSTAKKKEAFDKYERVMNYFQEANNQAMEQKKWYETREFAKQQYLPQVLSYAENIDRLDPQSQRLMAQNILDGWNRSTGDDYRLNSIDGSDPFIMTISGKKGAQIIDIRSMFAGDELLQEKLAMKMPEYQLKLQEKREQQGTQNRRISATEHSNYQEDVKSDMKLMETLGKKIDADKEFLTVSPEMEKIAKEYPDIFQSAMDVVWRENKEPGYLNTMIKSIQNSWNPKKVAALTSMVKYINKMTLDVANGVSRPNIFIEKVGSKAVPNFNMNADGFLKVLGDMVEEKKSSLGNNLERMEILEMSEGKPLTQQYKKSASNVMNPAQDPTRVQPNSGSGMNEPIQDRVQLKDPNTGEIHLVEQKDVDALISKGAIPVQ